MKKSLLFSICLLPLLVQGQVAVDFPVGDQPSGVSDTPADKDFWIAPNPASDVLDLYGAGISADGLKIRIFNMVGREITVLRPEAMANDQLLHVDTASWIAGTYLVRIEKADAVLKTMRFVLR